MHAVDLISDPDGAYYLCEEGDLETTDLTEVAKHVTLYQFEVKPEPLVRQRKDTAGARSYHYR